MNISEERIREIMYELMGMLAMERSALLQKKRLFSWFFTKENQNALTELETKLNQLMVELNPIQSVEEIFKDCGIAEPYEKECMWEQGNDPIGKMEAAYGHNRDEWPEDICDCLNCNGDGHHEAEGDL